MKLILSIFVLLSLLCCNGENTNHNNENASTTEVSIPNETTYYIVMSFTIEDQSRKELNQRFQRFNVEKFDPVSVYVSDVEEITTAGVITEDRKFKRLDAYEKYKLRPPVKNYIIIDRTFNIYKTYAEASRARLGEY